MEISNNRGGYADVTMNVEWDQDDFMVVNIQDGDTHLDMILDNAEDVMDFRDKVNRTVSEYLEKAG